ncbi:hypothetical protein ACFLWV_01300 [Chloroflexota bacterium]
MDQAFDILKWIGLAFAAGLIGYFARYLAKLVIEKLRKRKSGASHFGDVTKEMPTGEVITSDDQQFKLEKKKLKLEKKRIKKSEK